MHATIRTSVTLLLLSLAAACTKEPDPVPVAGAGRRVYVVCEGAYGSGNSALTLYNADSNNVVTDAFRSVNGRELGDVFQSMIRLQSGNYLLCVNNSDRVYRIDGTTLLQNGSLPIRQPRYALELPNRDVVITTMYSRKAFIIDAAAMLIKDSILLPYENPEGLAMAGGRLWICPWDTACRAVYPYNPATKSVGAPVALPGAAPQAALTDKEGMLWVLSGNNYKRVESWLTRIDPTTGAVLKQFRFGTADPVRPVLNPAGDSLYFIEVSYKGGTQANGIFRMGIHDASLPTVAFIPAIGLQYFWGVGIDPHSNEIYVSDPLGFTQQGRVVVYGMDGVARRNFISGVGPGQIVFN